MLILRCFLSFCWWEIGLGGGGGGAGKCLIFRETGHGANPSLPLTAVLFPNQQSKLEKADILEMTVKHLQNIQSSKMLGECLLPYRVPAPLPCARSLSRCQQVSSTGTSAFQTGRARAAAGVCLSPLDGEMEPASG